MSAKSARRLLERLLCDRSFLERLRPAPLTAQAFDAVSSAEGYACSLAELQAAAGDDPSVPAELWFSALLDALSPPGVPASASPGSPG